MTPPPAHFDIYEVRPILNHTVTPEEAATNTITISDFEPHAVVIANAKYARAYGEPSIAENEEALDAAIATTPDDASFNDIASVYMEMCMILSTIIDVSYSAPDTIVTFADLTEGAVIRDLYIPVTSPSPLSDVQFGIDLNHYSATDDLCSGTGKVVLQSPRGNDDLKNLITTIRSEYNNAAWDKTWLLVISDPENSRHDTFFEAKIIEYGRAPQGQTNIKFFVVLPQDNNTTPCHTPTSKTPQIEATMTVSPKPRSRLFDFLLPSQ